MPKEKEETAQVSEVTPALVPATAAPAFAPATYTLVGIDDGVTEVYVPQVSRSYVLADMTIDQLEMLHRLGWPHVEKSL